MCCVFRDDEDNNHSIRRADKVRALTRGRHLGALLEASEMFHQAMCLASFHPSGMAIEIAVKIATFFYIVHNRVAKSKLIAPLFY